MNTLLTNSRGNYFNNVILKSGYHQFLTESIDVWKIYFKYKEVPFKWLFIPLGLMNSLTNFMRLMVDIACDLSITLSWFSICMISSSSVRVRRTFSAYLVGLSHSVVAQAMC